MLEYGQSVVPISAAPAGHAGGVRHGNAEIELTSLISDSCVAAFRLGGMPFRSRAARRYGRCYLWASRSVLGFS